LSCALFDALPNPAFAIDAEGCAIAWNGAAARSYGWPAEEVLGKATPFASAAARAVLARAADAVQVGDSRSFDLPFLARDGSPRRARLRGAPFVLDDGTRGAVFVDTGGLELGDLERADPLESSVLQTVLDAIPTPIWFKTTDGIYRGCNLAFEQALGKTRDELVGRTVEAAGPKDLASIYREADRALFESGGTQLYEGELKRADGERRKVLFHKAAFRDRAGKVVGLAGALVDVTDLRRTEADLRHALDFARGAEDRLQRSDRLASLGTLAAGVAHELNNPLTFVLANSQWALERLAGGDVSTCQLDEVVRALGDVVQGARRMRVIVSDLRSAARDETVVDTLTPVDLRRVVDFAVQLTGEEIRRRARLLIEADEVPPVLGSETRLGQVLVNLLVNAAHAVPDGDKARNVVRVRLRREADDRLSLAVSDNGSGISAAARAHLFEPFFTTKPIGEGTGLGLWVCHGIVASHGGQIEVESAPGEGTTFRVLLPTAERARAEALAAGARVGPAGRLS
jgi:PAS domain S-box-containing protein